MSRGGGVNVVLNVLQGWTVRRTCVPRVQYLHPRVRSPREHGPYGSDDELSTALRGRAVLQQRLWQGKRLRGDVREGVLCVVPRCVNSFDQFAAFGTRCVRIFVLILVSGLGMIFLHT